jgi:hypothetical protein
VKAFLDLREAMPTMLDVSSLNARLLEPDVRRQRRHVGPVQSSTRTTPSPRLHASAILADSTGVLLLRLALKDDRSIYVAPYTNCAEFDADHESSERRASKAWWVASLHASATLSCHRTG